jgi:2'-hydroxyisoflavone reductase
LNAPVRLLVLGGTVFLGRAVVEAALAAGHEVSTFTRGRTKPGLFEAVEELHGDRDGDLAALEAGQWGAVIDTSGYVPRIVRASADLLEPRVPHYQFVSSISVYADFRTSPHEESSLARLDDPTSEDVQQHYGALKALCEQTVEDVYGPERTVAVRPGLIVGPHDPTDRFTYWVRRLARGGEVLAPGRPDRTVQLIDVRDLAEWMVRLSETAATGTFNATGVIPPVTMGELLETCRSVSGADARLTWVDDAFLLERGVGQWQELPLWLAEPEYEGMLAADISRAVAAGLTFRPMEETVRATLEWATAPDLEPPSRKQGVQLPPAGLDPQREAELLAGWHDRKR